jgi:uncharacterized protein YrzB (UPF0473 family)
MMLILTIHDRKGTELKFGDIVRIDSYSCGNHYSFYSEVKYLEAEQSIAPFHTFAFHSVEKVDKVPDTATKSTEERYDVWFECVESEESPDVSRYERYLMEWRECEHLLSEKIFRVHLKEPNKQPVQLSLL